MALNLRIENIGGPVVDEVLEVFVVYRGQGFEDALTLSIPAASEIAHDFMVAVPPGVVRFDFDVSGESFQFDRVAKAADLEISATDWEAVDDGQIAVEVTVRNTGNLDADGILVIGSVGLSDGTETEWNGQIDSIPVGAERSVEVLIDVLAGEYVVQLQLLTTSLEADIEDNTGALHAVVNYVDIGYEFVITPAGYWLDGSANVEVVAKATNSGVGAFNDVAEVSYSCRGASDLDDVATGKFEFNMRNTSSAVTESITLRSSPGTVECRFISQEQGSQTYEHEVVAKIVGVKHDVWECYRDSTINRHGDIGCAAREDERVVKWDLDRPLKVWANGDPVFIDRLWATLDRLSPILDMTFVDVKTQGEADLEAWVGITRDQGPESWKTGICADASGCASADWNSDHSVTKGTIAVWELESDWFQQVGLVDRRIEHVILHELIHALVPMDHRDDPFSTVNNINAPDWIELDPLEEGLFRLHRNRLIRPGMTMAQVREIVVLEDELLDPSTGRDAPLSPMGLLRAAFRTLQAADSAKWRLNGGWISNCSQYSFAPADYTTAAFYPHGADMIRFVDASDQIFHLDGEDWARESGVWVKDPPDIWDETNWWPTYGEVQVLLVSALYFASDRDVRIVSTSGGETTLGFRLDESILPAAEWYRSLTLSGQVTIDERTSEITAYEMEWYFDTAGSDSCDRYSVSATGGEYGVQFIVPNDVYFGTTDDIREAIDRINGPR